MENEIKNLSFLIISCAVPIGVVSALGRLSCAGLRYSLFVQWTN